MSQVKAADRDAAIKALEAFERHAVGMKRAIARLRAAVRKPDMLESFDGHVERTLVAVRGQLDPVRRRA